MSHNPAPLFDPDRGEVPAADFVEIYADDALLDDAGSGRHHKRTDPFAEMLAQMRAAVDDEPHPPLVDTDTAMTAIEVGRHQRDREVKAHRGAWGRWRWTVLALLIAVIGLVLILVTGCTPRADPAPSSTPLAFAQTVGDGGPRVIVGASSHVTGTYPARCVRGPSDDPRLPVMSCTPGSVRDDITDATKAATICNPHWSTRTIRAPQSETDRLKTIAMAAYGVPASARSTTELDHDVPLWLGGSNDLSNFWAQRSDLPGQGFRNSKDNVESRLHAAVCGRILGMRPVSLRDAQIAIARNWTTAEAVLGIPA